MKLKSYNQKNASRLRVGRLQVRFTRKGAILFSGKAREFIGLNKDSYVEFLQDEDSLQDWYIKKSNEEIGLRCRHAANSGIMVNSAIVSNKILESINNINESVGFLISKKPIKVDDEELWLIITSSAKS